ncbi:MAG: hypothetical protein IJ836_00020 [Spirochaetales bacterium]|nr:hypothetical protein [Spirochaetales bacterium]
MRKIARRTVADAKKEYQKAIMRGLDPVACIRKKFFPTLDIYTMPIEARKVVYSIEGLCLAIAFSLSFTNLSSDEKSFQAQTVATELMLWQGFMIDEDNWNSALQALGIGIYDNNWF